MTPTQARSELDGFLAMYGQSVTLSRGAATVQVQAHVSDFGPRDIDGANGLQIGDSRVIMSATPLTAAQWPAAGQSPVPRKGDRFTVAGRVRTVLYGYAAPYVGGELVRIELAVR